MNKLFLFLLLSLFVSLSSWAQTPTITSFSPSSGPVGTLVTINGANLSSPTAFNMGGVSAIAVSNDGTTLVGMVMPGAATGTISVTTAGGTASSTDSFSLTPTPFPNTQQGNKLVGTGNIGAARQGYSVAVSADGNTAIVGGYSDNSNQGAAWIYTRSGEVWSQQGNKLVGTGNIGAAGQGNSVAISADGNTAIVGGFLDNSGQGAAWVYTRTGSSWSQQGNKLVGTGNTGAAGQGSSVSLSADGNTAIVGGDQDNSVKGATWVFTRNEGIWSQQGNKLVGTGDIGNAQQGYSVNLSADGNTAIVGGYNDNSMEGAAWVFTRTGSSWSQQGNKLVGTGNTGKAAQARSVAISADGNTAIIGGIQDNSLQGAAWVFTRTGSSWSQQGNKLVGTGNTGTAMQGNSVSLSADGNTAIVGGYFNNNGQGATWVFTRTEGTWSQQGTKLVGTGNIGAAQQSQSVSLSADGKTAIVGGNFDNSRQGAAWVFIAPPPPDITSFTPTSGPVGTLVTISGTNLSNPTAFTMGGVSAIVVSNDGTTLVGMVMPGATTGTISVTVAGGTASSSDSFSVTPTPFPGTQQGNKLVGTGNTGSAGQGYSVSVSADGNTAIVGGFADNSYQGAAWVYTRTGSVWSQQGNKLVGTGNTGSAGQGYSVSVSADGNTAIVGGLADNTAQGAAWVYTRTGSSWSQQGNKLVGTGNIGAAEQGTSVSLSADGNTAIVGGRVDNSNQGAVWVFTRTGSSWSQQGSKLVGTGNTGTAMQGSSVSLSADGNTAMVGGYLDNSAQGAAWVYTRTGSSWSQQGNKLVGTGNSGAARQGFSVAVSADGNTAIVGGFQDNTNQGAAWVFTRSAGIWTQQGNKLVGTGNTGAARQGYSVAISADGNTSIVGGYSDNSTQGAAWVYNRTGSSWSQQGNKLVGTGNTGAAWQGSSVSLSADGNTAIVGGYVDNTIQGAAWVFAAPVFSLTTLETTAITTTSATGNGDITAISDNPSNRGIILYPYTNTDKEIGDADVTNFDETGSFGIGSFAFSLTPLTVNTRYNVRAHATNIDGTIYGSRLDFWTLANTPSAPTVDNPTATSLDVAVNANGNPDITTYAINETSTTNFVQANGTLGATAVWQTAADWGTKTVTGLTTGTQYTFKVKSRNGANVETAYSVTTNGTPVAKPVVTTQASTLIAETSATGNGNITATNGEDASNRGLILYPYTDTDKEIGGIDVSNFSEAGTFGTGTFTFSLTPLTVNTHYNARAHATNTYGTGYGARVDFWTLANVPSAPTVDSPTATTLDVAVNGNGNPDITEYTINETSTTNFVQTNGTLGATAVWQTAADWGIKTVTGLTTGTQYTFKVKARNGDNVETAYSVTTNGTPVAKPVVTTQASTLIAATSATGNGNITATNGEDASNRGIILYPYTDTDKVIADADVTNIDETGIFGTGSFTFTMSTLTVNTHYNARAHATNTYGTGYGARVGFWTLANTPSAPTVDNPTATSLDVAVNGNGNPSSTEYAIHEVTSNRDPIDRFVQVDGTLGNTVAWQTASLWGTTTVTGLTTGTQYTFKVKARNGDNVETAYSVTTNGTPVAKPVVTTQASTLIAETSATGNGNITATNGQDASNRGIVLYPYTDTDKVIADADVTNFDEAGTFGTGTFTFSLTPLTVNTRYNARAHATNTYGTGYGARVDFWTLANVPSAPTVDNPTATSLDVAVNANGNPDITTYAINETSTTNFVQANGTLGATAVWQTATDWGTTTVTGLSTGVTYTFKVKARNGANVETAYGEETSRNTCSNPTDGGEIDGAQTICYNTQASELGSVTEASDYGGTLEYQWLGSTVSAITDFTEIMGAATNTYSPGTLTQTSWFKRLARVSCKTDWIGAAESNVIKITVDPATVSGTISGNETITVHTSTGDLTVSGQTGNVLQWEKKQDASDWAIIPGTAAASYSETPVTVGTWSYRALVQSGVCESDYTEAHIITVIPAEPDHFTLTSPGTAISGAASGNFVIALFDQYNNPTYCRSNTTFNLSTNSTSSNHVFTPASPLVMTTNSYTASFTYTESKAGTHNITASYVSGSAGLAGESLTVTITITLPVPWVYASIGAANGTTEFFPSVNAGTYKQTAQGLSAPKSDVMNFVYQQLCGNGTVIVRLDDVLNGGWAGVMMRESNAPGAKTVLFKTKLYNPTAIVGIRSSTNGNISNTNQNLPNLRWMKIQRTNASTFAVYMSYDGTTWVKRHTATVPMNNCINAGFFTENAVSGRTTTAWMDHAEVVGYLKDTDEESTDIINQDLFEVMVYPNPATDNVTITIPDNEEKVKVTLINASGLVVETSEFNAMEVEYYINHIKPGMYLLRFERDGMIVNKRLVVL